MRASILLPVAVLVLWLTACTSRRNATERACGKAEKHMARAVYLCPDLLKERVQHDTVQVIIAGGAGDGAAQYAQADMDSVLHLCNELVRRAQERSGSARRALEEEREVKRTHTVQPDAVSRMRKALCDLEPVTHADSLILLKIWTENGKLRYWYNVLPQVATAVVTTKRAQVATQAACPPEGVASWYRTAFWCIITFLALGIAIVIYLVLKSWQHMDPDHQG